MRDIFHWLAGNGFRDDATVGTIACRERRKHAVPHDKRCARTMGIDHWRELLQPIGGLVFQFDEGRGGQTRHAHAEDEAGARRSGVGPALQKRAPIAHRVLAALGVRRERAETVEHYDQMIGLDSPEGNAVVQAAIDSLITQAKELERAIAVLDLKDIKFEGSDSLDAPDKVGGGN